MNLSNVSKQDVQGKASASEVADGAGKATASCSCCKCGTCKCVECQCCACGNCGCNA